MTPSYAQIITKILNKQSVVLATAISPDGKFMAGAVEMNNGDKAKVVEIRIWNVATGKIHDTFATRNLPYSTSFHATLSYSSDGVWLAHASEFEKVIYLRNTKLKQTKTISLRKQEAIKSLDFVPDTYTFVGFLDRSTEKIAGTRKVNDSSLTMWDVSTGNVKKRFNTDRVRVFVLKDAIIITGRSKLISLDSRNFSNQRESKTDLKLWGTRQYLTEFDKHNSLLALYSDEDLDDQYAIELWDLNHLKKISKYRSGKKQRLWSMCFSPDGKFLAEMISQLDPNKKTLSIREVATGKQKMMIDVGRDEGIPNMYYLCADKIMIHESSLSGGSLSLWHLATRKKHRTQIQIGEGNKRPTRDPYVSHSISNDLGIYVLGGAYTSEFDFGIIPAPKVYEGQIKIIDLKAFLKKADAEDKMKTKK